VNRGSTVAHARLEGKLPKVCGTDAATRSDDVSPCLWDVGWNPEPCQWTGREGSGWTELSDFRREFEANEHDWVRTPRITIAVPKIVRVLGYDRLPREAVKLNRRNIYARDSNRCQYCGRSFATKELTLDHVKPRVQGGGNSWTNLVCACVKCNARKGGRTPEQAGMRLIRVPVKPKRNPAISLRLGSPKYESWKAFLDEAYWTVELSDD